MKINIFSIVRDHLQTLYNAKSNKISYVDIILFYGLPVALGLIVFLADPKFKVDTYNISITFFGIFLALLLNIQVAVFSIFLRKTEVPHDKRDAERHLAHSDERRKLLIELNSNISYLTVFCSISLTIFLIFFVIESTGGIFSAITSTIYLHFILIFLMIIKRSHYLFQKEYNKLM